MEQASGSAEPVDRHAAPARTRQDLGTEADSVLVERSVEHGLRRTRSALRRRGLAAALLFDPLNIRYVTGTSLMPVWTLHAPERCVLVPADGQPVLWEYPSAAETSHRQGISVRRVRSWSALDRGEGQMERAAAFAAEVRGLLRELGGHREPLGVDRLDTPGFLALQDAGLTLRPAQLALEESRAIKSPDEVELIRRSVAVADAAVAHLRDVLRPGMTENEAWAAFTGHAFAHGGEYVECRLLSSGPRTNPWFQEASDRRIEPGDLVSFDTDLIGPAGYLADLSRAYVAGDEEPTARQRQLHDDARQFLHEIMTEIRPGAAFDELGARLSRRFPEKYHALRYPYIAHGSGLSDEYPAILFADRYAGEVHSAMVLSVEAYVGVEGEREGLKLEEQVLVTDEGVELLSHSPHDPRLAG